MILVVHPHTQEFLVEYPYEKVVTWGKSRSSFVLVLGNMMESHKIYFRTDQGEEINDLFRLISASSLLRLALSARVFV